MYKKEARKEYIYIYIYVYCYLEYLSLFENLYILEKNF